MLKNGSYQALFLNLSGGGDNSFPLQDPCFQETLYLSLMKKSVFKVLALINKAILPKYYKRDLKNLKKWEIALVGYKYWVTINSLD